MKNISLSLRKTQFGILSALMIIAFNILSGFFNVYEIKLVDTSMTFGLISVTVFYVFYLSIWFLLREILVTDYGQFQLKSFLTWLIVLISIIAILTIINMVIGIKIISILTIIIAFPGLVIFIIFMNKVMKINKEEVQVIGHLQNFFISLMIIVLILFFIALFDYRRTLAETDKLNIDYVKDFLNAIPSVFILLFFNEQRKEIIKSQNANP